MTARHKMDEFQSCIDPARDRDWDEHTTDEKERCSTSAEVGALLDPFDEAQLRDALVTDPQWARAEMTDRRRLAAELAAGTQPETAGTADREVER